MLPWKLWNGSKISISELVTSRAFSDTAILPLTSTMVMVKIVGISVRTATLIPIPPLIVKSTLPRPTVVSKFTLESWPSYWIIQNPLPALGVWTLNTPVVAPALKTSPAGPSSAVKIISLSNPKISDPVSNELEVTDGGALRWRLIITGGLEFVLKSSMINLSSIENSPSSFTSTSGAPGDPGTITGCVPGNLASVEQY